MKRKVDANVDVDDSVEDLSNEKIEIESYFNDYVAVVDVVFITALPTEDPSVTPSSIPTTSLPTASPSFSGNSTHM